MYLSREHLDSLSWPQLAELFDLEVFNAQARGLSLVQFCPEFSQYCVERIPVLLHRWLHA